MGGMLTTPRKANDKSSAAKRASTHRSTASANDIAKMTVRHSLPPSLQPGAGAPSMPASGQLLNLKATLDDSDASAAFMAFARADMSEENLEFFLQVADFRAAWDAKEGEGAAQQEMARSLITTFLKAGAPKQVCIGDWRVKKVLDDAEAGVFSKGMFAEPAAIAENTLAQDIFPRFQDSDPGLELGRRRPELCKPPR